MRGKSLQTAMLLCGARWERGPFPRQNPPGGIGHPGTAGSGSAAHGRGLAGTVSPRSFAPAHPSMPTTFLLPGISAYPPPPSPPLSPRWLDTWRDAETVWPVVFQPDGRCSASNGLQFWAGACRDTYALLRLDARWILIRQWEAWRGGNGDWQAPHFGQEKGGDPSLEHRSRLPSGYQDPIGLPRPRGRAGHCGWGRRGNPSLGTFFFGGGGGKTGCWFGGGWAAATKSSWKRWCLRVRPQRNTCCRMKMRSECRLLPK